jgi:hypothetical protein
LNHPAIWLQRPERVSKPIDHRVIGTQEAPTMHLPFPSTCATVVRERSVSNWLSCPVESVGKVELCVRRVPDGEKAAAPQPQRVAPFEDCYVARFLNYIYNADLFDSGEIPLKDFANCRATSQQA